MDAETLRLAAAVGLNQSICVVCHEPTFFIVNERKSNIPLTCGGWKCMLKAKETLTK